MFHVLDSRSLEWMAEVRASMFTDRAGQFVTRHNWPLRLDATGFEVDEFDDPSTTYCVVEEQGRHWASLRLRDADTGSMVERHFPEMWRTAEASLRGGREVTRFCAAPLLSPDDRLSAVSDLLLGLCRHCQKTGIERFFGVVFPAVARVIRQCGWGPTVLDCMKSDGGILVLAEWHVSSRVAWNIQEVREFRERSWAERRAAAAKHRMVA